MRPVPPFALILRRHKAFLALLLCAAAATAQPAADDPPGLLESPGLPEPPLGKIGLAVSADDPDRVYALIETSSNRDFAPSDPFAGVLWRSDDRGDSWRLVSRDLNLITRPLYYTRMAAAPDRADEITFVATRQSVSLDGGRTVESEGYEQPGWDHHDIWIDPLDPDRRIVGHDGGVSLTNDRGKSWYRPQLPIAQMYHVSTDDRVPYFVYGNRQDGPSMRGPGRVLYGGRTQGIPVGEWHSVGGCEVGFSMVDRGNRNDGQVQLTRDGGATWTNVTANLPDLPPRVTYRFRTRGAPMAQPDVPATGTNPPYGALLHYWIPQSIPDPARDDTAAEEGNENGATIRVRDADGNLIRTLDDLSAAPGLHRVTWDLRQLEERLMEGSGDVETSEAINRTSSLRQELRAIEEAFFDLRLTGTGQDSLRWPRRLYARLTYLARSVAQADVRPTDQQAEVWEMLRGQLAEQEKRFDATIAGPLADLNRTLADSGFLLVAPR